MTEQFANKIQTTLASDYSAGSGTCVVTSATGMPATGTFRLRLANSAGTILRVDSRVGTTLTVTVEQDDGNAPAGTAVWHGPTAGAMAQLKADAIAGAGAGFTPLDQSAWTWLNQGASVVTQTGALVNLAIPPLGASNLRGRYTTTPATPWTVTMAYRLGVFGTFHTGYGLMLYDGTKLVVAGIQMTAGNLPTLNIYRYTNVTTFSASSISVTCGHLPSPLWLRVNDTGVNLVWGVSVDGIHWQTLLTEARLAFLANVNNVGFCGDSGATAVTPFPNFTIYSWAVS